MPGKCVQEVGEEQVCARNIEVVQILEKFVQKKTECLYTVGE